jgi:hypothetical protein
MEWYGVMLTTRRLLLLLLLLLHHHHHFGLGARKMYIMELLTPSGC